jgi:quercetin dioxygenase-like cupin family protein
VQIRDREQPHLHAAHDLVVTLLVGNGELHLRGTSQRMEGGDVAIIPRGVPHYFVNTGSAPAAAFVTMAPPAERPDQVPVPPAP